MKRIEICIRPMVSVLYSRWDGEGKKPLSRNENLQLIRIQLFKIVGDAAATITFNRVERTASLRFEEISNYEAYGIIDKLQAKGLSSRLIA